MRIKCVYFLEEKRVYQVEKPRGMLISSKGRDTTSLRGGGKQISCTAKKLGWKKIAQGEPGKSNSSKVILLTGPHKLLSSQNIKHKACHATENCTALPPSKWPFPKDNLNLTHVSPIMLWQISLFSFSGSGANNALLLREYMLHLERN